jgi:Ser/Thr protein kinase RdoA (MazF antagonist)
MSPDLAFSMGRTLAKFHALVKTLPHPQACWMDPSTAVTAADDADVQALLSANLPSGITHGDLHPGNVHVVPGTPDDVHAIMDFEDGGVGLFMADLARSIIDTCIVTDGKRIDPELVRSEVAGYETLRRMTADERALLPSAVTYVTDACIRWFREFGFEAYIPDHRARAATFVSPF